MRIEPTRSGSSNCGVDWFWLADEDDVLADDEALVVDPLDDEERWRRQLVLYKKACAGGFEGPWFEALATTVVQYAMGILTAGLCRG